MLNLCVLLNIFRFILKEDFNSNLKKKSGGNLFIAGDIGSPEKSFGIF